MRILSSVSGALSAALLGTLLVLGSLHSVPVQASQPMLAERLSDADYRWIGARIYQNESASNPRYLIHWGQGEDFPSLGIGHFIWFPANVSPPFEETFPQMVRFVGRSVPPPDWLKSAMTETNFPPAPWNSRNEFQTAQNTVRMNRLREWLLETQPQQARFIVTSFEQRWQSEIASLPANRQVELERRLQAVASFKEGFFSVIDYFNFKGIGANPKEKYQGEGWGLVSVLEHLPENNFSELSAREKLAAFIQSAKQRLKLRTELAPPQRNEARWLKGWFKRLDGYRAENYQTHDQHRRKPH